MNTEHVQPGDVDRMVQILSRGGVVLSPTDTVYGLGCDPFAPEAVQRILQIKGRDAARGFLMLLPDASQAPLYAEWSEPARMLAADLWPGPVTLVARASSRVPELVRGEAGKVGLRVPDDAFLLGCLRKWAAPILSTSANRSGQPAAAGLQQLRREFADQVDLLVESEVLTGGQPSTVVDVTVSPPRVLRFGVAGDRVTALLSRLH